MSKFDTKFKNNPSLKKSYQIPIKKGVYVRFVSSTIASAIPVTIVVPVATDKVFGNR